MNRLDKIIGMPMKKADKFATELGYIALFYESWEEAEKDMKKNAGEYEHLVCIVENGKVKEYR